MTDAPRIFSSGRFEFEGTRATRHAFTLRSLFLDQIEVDREASERVLRTLYRDVYEANLDCFPINMAEPWDQMEARSREIWRKANPGKPWVGEKERFYDWEALAGADDCYPSLVPLREAIRDWSIKSRLDADWIREEAFKAVRHYSLDWLEPFRWVNDYHSGGPYYADRREEQTLESEYPGLLPYKPGYEDQSGYLAERRKELARDLTVHPILRFVSDSDIKFRNQLNAFVDKAIASLDKHYCERIAGLYVAQGLKRVRLRPSPERERDVRWAVTALVSERKYKDIAITEAEKTGQIVTKEAIATAVHQVLRALRLKRPQGRPNSRPRPPSRQQK